MPAHADAGKSDAADPQSWWQLATIAFSEFWEDKAPRMSAALAYYTAFALAPMLVIAVFIARLFIHNGAEARSQVIAAMGQVIGGMSPDQANQILSAAEKHSGIFATTVSIILAVIGATGVFGELQDSLNTIWDVKPKPNQGIWMYIRTRILSLAMVLSIAFILLTSLAISTFVTGMSGRLTGESQAIGEILDFVLSIGVTFVLFGLIFKVLPDVELTWPDVWRGALVTAVLFTIGKVLLGIYLSKGSAASAFGAAASLAALLLWVNYSAWIVFFGAEFTKALLISQGRKVSPSPHAIPLSQDERLNQGIRDSAATVVQGSSRPLATRAPVMARSLTGPLQFSARSRVTTGSGILKDVLIGAGGAGLGAVVAYFGSNRAHRKPAVSDEMANKIRHIDTELRRLKRRNMHPAALQLEERLDELRSRVHAATAKAQSKEAGRPMWVVRLGNALAGR